MSFTDTEHCRSGAHCKPCRMDESFRAKMQKQFGEYDCPHGWKVGCLPGQATPPPKPMQLPPKPCKYREDHDRLYMEARPCKGKAITCHHPDGPGEWYAKGCKLDKCALYEPEQPIFDGLISVCINTQDEGPRLRKTIEDFRENLAGNQYEFIVVADGVTDGCADDLGDDVTVIRNASPVGCGRAKCQLTEAAQGDVLMFFDAHHAVMKGYLAELAIQARETGGIVQGFLGYIEYSKDWEIIHRDKVPAEGDDRAMESNRTNELSGRVYQTADPTHRKTIALWPKRTVTLGVCCTRETLEKIGGWNAYSGRHGWQEQGVTLRAAMAGVPVYLHSGVTIGHEWRDKMPYKAPPARGHHQNMWQAIHTVATESEWREIVPELEKRTPKKYRSNCRAAIQAEPAQAQRESFDLTCREKPDGELLDFLGINQASAAGPNIVTLIPYRPGGDLGAEYNALMERLADDEWALFLDHDAMQLNPSWYQACLDAIAQHPDAGWITCLTNRIGNDEQRDETAPTSDNIDAHRAHAKAVWMQYGTRCKDVTRGKQLLSGVMILTSKAAWRKAGGFCAGFLGVDNDYHKRLIKAGLKCYMMEGLYIYHGYTRERSWK